MEQLDYHSLRQFAGSWGLVVMCIGFFLVLLYSFWPGSKQRFDEAALSVLDDEDTKSAASPLTANLVDQAADKQSNIHFQFPPRGCCHG